MGILAAGVLAKSFKLTSSFLMIEIHPWKCYKKARKRLRQRQRHMNEGDWKEDFPEWKNIVIVGSPSLNSLTTNWPTAGLFVKRKLEWLFGAVVEIVSEITEKKSDKELKIYGC